MTREELISQIYRKKSCLSVGLDTDINKIPDFLKNKYEDPVFEFNKRVIDATQDLCVCYKLNTAFYESAGPQGWATLEKTRDYIPTDILTIADAKRGDIGNTSKMYAKAFFETYGYDALTVAPYMGHDSVKPFLDFEGKWVILLGLTSNSGSRDFQYLEDKEGRRLYTRVIRKAMEWGNPDSLMFVVGATHPEELKAIREMASDHFFLIPGVGKQGGSVKEVMEAAHVRGNCGLLINSSRGIIYAGEGEGFAEEVRAAAGKLQREMARFLV